MAAAEAAAVSQVAATQEELAATKQALQASRDQEQARAAELMQGQQDLSDALLAKREADRGSEILVLEVQTLQVGQSQLSTAGMHALAPICRLSFTQFISVLPLRLPCRH